MIGKRGSSSFNTAPYERRQRNMYIANGVPEPYVAEIVAIGLSGAPCIWRGTGRARVVLQQNTAVSAATNADW